MWRFLSVCGFVQVACQGFLVREACVGVLVGGAVFLLSRVDCCIPRGGVQTCPWGAPTVPRPRVVAPSLAPGAVVRAPEGWGADRMEVPAGLELGPHGQRGGGECGRENPRAQPPKCTGELIAPSSAVDSGRQVNGIYPGICFTCEGLARGEGPPCGYVMDLPAVTRATSLRTAQPSLGTVVPCS